jgi:hypothetical protein
LIWSICSCARGVVLCGRSTSEPRPTRNDHRPDRTGKAHWSDQPYATTVFGINAQVRRRHGGVWHAARCGCPVSRPWPTGRSGRFNRYAHLGVSLLPEARGQGYGNRSDPAALPVWLPQP